MATLNFPDAPDTGDTYFDTNAGFNYEWNGSVWISKDLARPNTTKEIDDISSGFDGSDTTFTLQVDGVNIVPQDVKQLVITVGGAVQNPGDDYTVSGSTLTFTTAPSASVSFYGTFLGSAVSLNTISAASVSPSSFTTTSNYTVGSINVSGASTITNFILTGFTTITDPDVTYLNTGIGTVSNVILTQDNSGLGATIGAAVGVVTYYGDGSNLTGTALTMMPLSYDPGISSTSQQATTNIITTWNRPIEAGSGTITIRSGSASGTVVDQFVVGSSSSITFADNQLTLNPAADLSAGVEYFVTYPAGSIKAVGGQHENSQVISDFTTKAQTMWTWGNNYQGALGTNDNTQYSSPVQIPGTTWKTGYASMGSAIAVKTTGTLWMWGANYYGQLGQNAVASPANVGISSPTQVGTDTTWGQNLNHINVTDSTFVIKTNGTLWTWGLNKYGCLGLNQGGITGVQHSSPAQIGTDTTWSDISGCSYRNSFAIKTDGTFWSWGYNNNGELGFHAGPGPGSSRSSPVQVGTETTWSKVANYNKNSMGLKTDGTIWTWGSNSYGALGLNDTVSRSSPTQVPGTWSNISSGTPNSNNQGIAQKSDGTLWVMGDNDRGFLGQNEAPAWPYSLSSPTQVPGTTWDVAQMAHKKVIATKTDGTIWSWGYNYAGSGGTGDEVQNSSPTQIGTDTNWISSSFRGGRNATIIMRS